MAAPATTAQPSTAPAPDASSQGKLLFQVKGCGACHGSDAQGSAIAPGLAGHTGNKVRRQARAPLGLMPVFPPSSLSNMGLAQIAEYVESLSGDHTHLKVSDTGTASTQHHWMTLFAPEDDSATEAVHHIDHIITLVAGEQLSQMQEARSLTEEGNLHDATHIIENMLAGVQLEDLMHASLARSSVMADDTETALHHLDHVMEQLSGDPASAEQVAEIRDLRESGDTRGAAQELGELTGTAHEEEHEADPEDEDDHDDGGHDG